MSGKAHKPCGPYELLLKRPLDIILSGTALVILSPVMGITALLVKNKLGSPVIFTQDRPGKNEKIFKLYKFRSMSNERDKNGDLLPDTVRLTRFGRVLRSTSLDEGLSGLAQANGRSFLSWEKIFEYDLEYVNNVFFINDCRIILKTIRNVLSKHDVADFSQVYIGEDGKKHIVIGDEDCIIHAPLDEERSGGTHLWANKGE